MKEKIRKFISYVSNGQGHKAQSQFDTIVRSKVREQLENKRVEVAQNMYKNSTED